MNQLYALACFAVLGLPIFALGKPNLVVVITDDQGWGDLSMHGNTGLSTPNIDRLARQGAAFDRFYISPVCSPTRAEFLTGRYHPRSSVSRTSLGGERMDLDEETIAQVLKKAGYRTGLFGKWHNGTQHPYHPNSRGFDEFYGFTSGHLGQYFDPQFLDHNGEITRGKGFIIDDLTDRAMAFMESKSRQHEPFFVCLTYNTPHSPNQVPDRFWSKFAGKELTLRGLRPDLEDPNHTRAALAMCENIDWNMGRLMEKLDALGEANDTIVVYLSDNGPNGWRWNDGMKGRKGTTDEGGVRSPLFVRWPAKIKAGTVVPSIAGVIDLLPTLTDMVGFGYVPVHPLDGISQKTALLNGKNPAPDRILFSHWGKKVSARTQQYRFDHEGALFDMGVDPNQHNDVSKDRPEVTKRLRKAVEDWRADALAEMVLPDKRPLIICHPTAPNTQLPARDARLHGDVKRSNHFPNSSYITNWKSTDDSLTWDVTVAAEGLYHASIYYACSEKNVGSQLELSFGDAVVRQKILVANDAPLVGPAEDRTLREESYEKDFKSMDLGVIHLKQGAGQLTLKASSIPGDEALEFRLLVLRKANGSTDK